MSEGANLMYFVLGLLFGTGCFRLFDAIVARQWQEVAWVGTMTLGLGIFVTYRLVRDMEWR